MLDEEIRIFLEALRGARGLLLYRGILQDPVCRAFTGFLEAVAGRAGTDQLLEAYAELFYILSREAGETGTEPVGDAWQNHLLNLILFDDNAFSQDAAAYSLESLGESLKDAAARDLAALQLLYKIDACKARDVVSALTGGQAVAGVLPAWEKLAVSVPHRAPAGNSAATEMKIRLHNAAAWGGCLQDLAGYYRQAGSGIFGKYGAFRWVSRSRSLEGIAEPDRVSFQELTGYKSQQQVVLDNTERFLAGLPANNILLYGDRGTGKSSTVKALLNRYQNRGLRLVEVPRSALGDYLLIIKQLRRRPQRFILFIDDLSFEESETEYKELKAVLEGGLENRPANVLIYATSNRRHLVKENFTDRQPVLEPNGEVRPADTVQEKLSLADRFGITVLYTAPDRKLYLDIVREAARLRGLQIEDAVLEQRALQWESRHNGRSCRTARQFVDYLSGEPGVLPGKGDAPEE